MITIFLGIFVIYSVTLGTVEYIQKTESRKASLEDEKRLSLLTPEQREKERLQRLKEYCNKYYNEGPTVYQKKDLKYYDNFCKDYKPIKK